MIFYKYYVVGANESTDSSWRGNNDCPTGEGTDGPCPKGFPGSGEAGCTFEFGAYGHKQVKGDQKVGVLGIVEFSTPQAAEEWVKNGMESSDAEASRFVGLYKNIFVVRTVVDNPADA